MICDARNSVCSVVFQCRDQSGMRLVTGPECWCGNDICQKGEYCSNNANAFSLCRTTKACPRFGTVESACVCLSETKACAVGYMCVDQEGCQQPTPNPTST